jgi:hypothetical protein
MLETEFETAEGAVTLVDCMPIRQDPPYLVRLVVGQRGQVRMRTEFVLRLDYGALVCQARRRRLRTIAGPVRILPGELIELLRKETPIRLAENAEGVITTGASPDSARDRCGSLSHETTPTITSKIVRMITSF